MKRSLAWIIGGLLVGVIVHIFSVLWVPMVAEDDAWSRLNAVGTVNRLSPLSPDTVRTEVLPDLDPSMRHAVCIYDLTGGPLRIQAPLPPTYWSVALYDRHGVNYYALNDRLVGGRSIQLWVATRQQLLSIEENGDQTVTASDRLVIGAPGEQGFALFRGLVPAPSYETQVNEALAGIKCSIVDTQTAKRESEEQATGTVEGPESADGKVDDRRR